MDESYLTDEEFHNYFPRLGGLRERVARDLGLEPRMKVLDLATGYGFFALELLKAEGSLEVVGIDISDADVSTARANVQENNLTHKIKIVRMDATRMDFPDGSFDAVVNFLGLEDIHMTRGWDGVRAAFSEVYRALKSGGRFCFVAMPPDCMETQAQRLEVALFSRICDATWLPSGEYGALLEETGFELMGTQEYATGRKLTPDQAREEIRFACENVPIIYGIHTPSFDEVWRKFGKEIDTHGLGHYSKVVLFKARRNMQAAAISL